MSEYYVRQNFSLRPQYSVDLFVETYFESAAGTRVFVRADGVKHTAVNTAPESSGSPRSFNVPSGRVNSLDGSVSATGGDSQWAFSFFIGDVPQVQPIWSGFNRYVRIADRSTISVTVEASQSLMGTATATISNIPHVRRTYFDANGGSVSPAFEDTDNNASLILPTPTRSGFNFNGWYTAASGGTFIGNAGQSVTVTSTRTIYAQWSQSIPNYTVYYNSNGGSNNPSSQVVQEGQTVTLPSPGTRTGYTFNGWVSSYNGFTYSTGSTSHQIFADTVFTASWSQLTWTVSFSANGGTTPSSQTVAQGGSIQLPSSTRTGFTFNGWWTSSSGGSFIGNAGSFYTPTNNITLSAQWIALAPGFTDQSITSSMPINININTLADNTVTATNADQYSLVSSGGTFPSWLSIANVNGVGVLSGSTNIAGTYTFKVRATNTSTGDIADSNIITLTVYYPGKRATSSSAFSNLSTAKRWNGSSWVDVTIMRRWNGTSWVNITN